MRPLLNSRILIVLALNALLALAVYQCNVWIAPYGLYLVLDALFILFAGFYLRIRHVLIIALILALLTDAIRPVPFGVGAFAYLGAAGIMVVFRNRLHREKGAHVRLAALAINFMFLVFHTALHLPSLLDTGAGAVWSRIGTDALLSLAVAALVAPAWLGFQKWFFQICGINLASELQRKT